MNSMTSIIRFRKNVCGKYDCGCTWTESTKIIEVLGNDARGDNTNIKPRGNYIYVRINSNPNGVNWICSKAISSLKSIIKLYD